MYTILLSGGSGKRLWPLSNDLCSKQYIQLVNHDGDMDKPCSMLQRVWRQLGAVGLDTIIAASTAQVEIIKNQLGEDTRIAIEPDRRDTFPAVMLSCAYLSSVLGASDDDYVAIQPVDPYTTAEFFELLPHLEQQLVASGAEIGLIGARPTYPSQKYGYIVPRSTAKGDYIEVKGFKEKPDIATAKELMSQGALWNCGVFCFRLSLARKHLAKYNLPLDYNELFARYSELPKISFDYEVLEHASSLIAVSHNGMWKDLGTWNTLAEEMYDSSIGRVITDATSTNVNVVNVLDIPVVVLGAHNMIVAASHDGILVADKHQSSFLKEALNDLRDQPRYEERRWGTIKTLDQTTDGEIQVATCKVKLFAGMNSSYHHHNQHDEAIVVTQGSGEIIIDGKLSTLSVGDTVKIPRGSQHSIRAIKELKFLETQIGTIVKDDIHRETFDWNEVKQINAEVER